MQPHTNSRRRWAAGLAASVALTATGLVTAPSAQAASLPDAIVEYAFTSAPTNGSLVPNLAEGSPFGPAEIINAEHADYEDASLVLPGGGKDGTGTWVRLPDSLLADATAATVQLEVRASEAMRSRFHFLFNIGNDSNGEYFFSSLKCAGEGRSPLVGLKTGAGEHLVQAGEFGCGWQPDEWLSVTAVSHSDHRGELYVNGRRVAEGDLSAVVSQVADQSLNTIGRSPWPDELFAGAVSTFRVYDQALDAEQIAELSDADAALHPEAMQARAQSILEGLTIPSTVSTVHLGLPTMNGAVTWQSSDPEVIATDGRVTQPAKGEEPVSVELTAVATHRGYESERRFIVEVQPSDKTHEELVREAADRYVIAPVVSAGEQLPPAPDGFTLTLAGDDALHVDGRELTIDTDQAEGTITATLVHGEVTITKAFRVRALGPSAATEILAYHRTPTTASEANNGDIAYSMHLAKADGDTWTPYNDNYGIFFARTAQEPTNAVDVRLDNRSLRDPHLFRLADGTFGIVAVRTARGTSNPHPDDPAGTVLFATSDDLLSYEEAPNGASLLHLGEDNGVNDPYAVYDSSKQRYVVGWRDDAGIAKYTTFAQLGHDEVGDGIRLGEVWLSGEVSAEDSGIGDYVVGHSLPVERSIVQGLDIRFLPVHNTSVQQFEPVTVRVGDRLSDLALPQRVELGYSDGSTARKSITGWDQSGLTPALAPDEDTFAQAGTFSLTGHIDRQQPYPLPFAEDRADPSVYKWEWERDGVSETKYLMIATNDIHGDNVWQHGTPHMPIRMADSIMALADTPGDKAGLIDGNGFNPKESTLLEKGDVNADGQAMTGSFWAPEFHEIGGRLSILFMPSYNNVWTDGAAAIMQLKQDGDGDDLDPTKAENWTKPQTVKRADGRPLSINAAGGQGMSLDMSYFLDDAGQSYYTWQQLGATYIATVDPADPTTVTSDPVLIVSPEYAWDNSIAEGPNVLNKDGKLYMLYSGSAVGVTYTTGLAMADASGATNLLDPSAWHKLNYPIQKSSIFDGAWQLGTGHGMWSEDEQGELLYVFHAYAPQTEGYGNFSGRDMYVRRVHWAADGLPVLDMSADQEVASDAVAELTITVLPAGDASPEPPSGPEPTVKPGATVEPRPGENVAPRPGLPRTGVVDVTTWRGMTRP